jgi:hypothetical protein
MRTKVTLVLLFLNVALFFFIFKFERGWRTEHAAQEARRRVLGAEAANIQSLEIATGTSAPTVSLEKRGDLWYLTRPFEWPANPVAVQRIITDLLLLDHETSFSVQDLKKNGQSLADYGLDPPALTVSFSSLDPAELKAAGGTPAPKPVSLRLGKKTPDGNLLYLLSPDGENVHVVLRSIADSLTQGVDQLRSDTLFSIPVFEARFFNLTDATPAPIRLSREGNRWSFESPVKARASKLDTELTINALNGLHVKSFLPAAPPEAGANSPLRITLEGNNRTETLLLFAPVASPTPAAAGAGATPPDLEYYGRMTDTKEPRKEAYFTVVIPGALKARLDNAQIALRERRLLDFDTRAVTALTLSDATNPGQPELTLQRLDVSTAATAESTPWQLVRREAGQAPQTQPADIQVVQHLLEQLALLSAKEPGGFLNDAPTKPDLENWGFNRPVRVIVLTVAGTLNAASTTVRLEIGVNSDRKNAYARVSGADSVYEIDPEIIREASVRPLDYRDRLLRELPAGAQITGLRLLDATSKAVIFERQISTALPKDDPLQGLLGQLRVLRAARFDEDHFTPTVNIAGEDRPWKYQLEVTIVLVGGSAAAQTSTTTLFLGERAGGTTQLAGSPDFGAVWELEQPFIDALWPLTYVRDPGPAAPAPAEKPAAAADQPAGSPKAPDAK